MGTSVEHDDKFCRSQKLGAMDRDANQVPFIRTQHKRFTNLFPLQGPVQFVIRQLTPLKRT